MHDGLRVPDDALVPHVPSDIYKLIARQALDSVGGGANCTIYGEIILAKPLKQVAL
ncbi:hypothetical protein BH10PSE14_BH10PSE14_11950 [soil metagenome]